MSYIGVEGAIIIIKNVMDEWKEFNPDADKSIKDDFMENPSPSCKKLITYLNNGEIKLAAPEREKDVISGDEIGKTHCILTDGEYSWSSSLAYYVEKYNLSLPKEFEEKIISAKG